MQNTGHEFVITLRTASKAIADKHKMLLFLLKIGFFLHIESHRNTLSESRYLEYVMSLITFKPLQGESASYQATWPPIELSSDSGKTQESPLQWLIAISIIIIIIIIINILATLDTITNRFLDIVKRPILALFQ